MAPPIVRSVSAASNTAGALAVPKPAGLAAGDYLLAWHYTEDDGSLSELGAPSGWNLIGSEAGITTGGHPNAKVWAKVATSTDAATSSFTFTDANADNDNSAVVLAITAGTYNATTPIAAGPTFLNGDTVSSTAHTAPSVAGVTDGLLITAHGTDSGGTAAAYSPPPGMTEQADTNSGSAAFTALAVCAQALTASGATGARTATCSISRPWKGVALVVNPSTISGGGDPGGGTGGGAGGSAGGFAYSGFLDGQPYPTIPLGTTVVNVSGSSALTTALANAAAGQKIVLGSGTYSGAFALSGKNGTSTAGISIEAGTTGGAVFAAGSTFSVTDSSYVTLKGLSFPYELGSGSTVQFRGVSHHCRVTRCLFGPAAIGTAGATKTQYVFLSGAIDHVRVDHNELRFKTNPGNAILGDGDFGTNQAVRHIRIDHNYVHDIKPEASNEKEPIRLGVSTMSKTMSYSVVERNVFVACIAEPEIVSVKAGGVRVSGNTFLRSIGGPVYRHGTDGVITDNYVIDDRVGSSSPPPANSYRYFRFAPTALRNAALADSVQLSEFAVMSGSTRLTGMTITATNNSSPVGEEPAKAGDNDTATKWVSLNKTSSMLVYDFGSARTATGYQWATGNDAPERDPVAWTVSGSTDGATWTALDTRSSYATTTARSTYVSTDPFLWGGGGGTPVTPPAGGNQTLGVGGVATPAGAILATSDTTSALTITTSGTSANPRVYDGQGHTVGRVTFSGCQYVVVQNYNVRSGNQYGVVFDDASNVTLQNCDIANVRVSGDGDLNCITLWGGTKVRIKYNTAINFVSGDPGGSHTDWLQTWVSSSHPNAASQVEIVGNRCVGPANPSRDNSIPSIHQWIMIEGQGRGGNSGGSGHQTNWYVSDNYVSDSWNQAVKVDAASTGFNITRNNFAGSSDRVIEDDTGGGIKFWSDNQITGNYGSVGMSITSGSGPATVPF